MSCSSPSPLTLPVGTHSALCTAADSFEQGQTASCRQSLIVLPPLELSSMRFLAFGDSLTAGTTSASLLLDAGPPHSYPAKLLTELARRYITQTFEIENAGLGGELAANAVGRFRGEFLHVRPEIVLLMEGTNDLLGDPSAAPGTALAALDAMLLEAGSQGVRVVLASLLPQRAAGGREAVAEMIPSFNLSLQALARRHDVPYVDVFTPLSETVCGPAVGGLTCIGQDNLHPTEAGYQVMALAFADATQWDLDISQQIRRRVVGQTVTAASTSGPSRPRPPLRGASSRRRLGGER